MPALVPRPGLGSFQWNTGGWFGGQIGSTAWLVPGAVMLAPRAPGVAGVWLACCLAVNALGVALWRRRDRLRPFPAIQGLLMASGLAMLVAFGSLSLHASELRSAVGFGHRDWLALAGVPVLMAWFAVLDRAGRRPTSHARLANANAGEEQASPAS